MMKTKQQRTRRSSQLWTETVSDWQRSGISAAAYAEQHHIGVSSLRKWGTRLRKGIPTPDAVKPIDATPCFLPVTFDRSAEGETPPTEFIDGVELTLPSGHVVRLRGRVSCASLASLIQSTQDNLPC